MKMPVHETETGTEESSNQDIKSEFRSGIAKFYAKLWNWIWPSDSKSMFVKLLLFAVKLPILLLILLLSPVIVIVLLVAFIVAV